MSGAFHYQQPPTIYWGPGSISNLSAELDRLEVHRPFLISTRSVAGNEKLMGRLRKVLGRELAGQHSSIGQHAPEGDVQAAIAAVQRAAPDGIVSFGGGSPIDTAKIVALEGGEVPHVAVPTTLSVAELGPSAGVTDASGRKGGRLGANLLPEAVIYDAELTLPTPMELWLATGIRALDHGVESILEPGDHPHADTLALEGIRRLFSSLPAVKQRPEDVGARTENQLGAWFGYSLARAAVGLSHMLGKQLGSPYGIPHGITSCLLLPHVMRYRARTQAGRLALMAPAMGVARPGASEVDLASAAADAVAALISELGLPHHLGAYRLTEDQLRAAAQPLAKQHSIEDLLGILHAAA
jgi:alcohol dehydrogenase class IV